MDVGTRVADSGANQRPPLAALVPDMMLFFASWWSADTNKSIFCMKNGIEMVLSMLDSC